MNILDCFNSFRDVDKFCNSHDKQLDHMVDFGDGYVYWSVIWDYPTSEYTVNSINEGIALSEYSNASL